MTTEEINDLWTKVGFDYCSTNFEEEHAIAIKKFEIDDYDFEIRIIMTPDVFRSVNFVHGVTVHGKFTREEMRLIMITMDALKRKRGEKNNG